MAYTSLGKVSNSASRAFTNAKSTISLVNYGKVVGSYNNNDIAYYNQQIKSAPTKTINLPVTNNVKPNNIY
jgi:hypothetical protein